MTPEQITVPRAAKAVSEQPEPEGRQFDPRTALEHARAMERYVDSFNGHKFSVLDDVDRQNLAVALDNLQETAAMLLNIAERAKAERNALQAERDEFLGYWKLAAAKNREMQSAIEALQAENERLKDQFTRLKKMIDDGSIHERTYSAGIKLERRNAELQAKLDAIQKQEPVAYSVGNTLKWHEGKGAVNVQLYASPKALEPLTSDAVKVLCSEADYTHASAQEKADFINWIRHGEKAHGIGSQQ